MEIVKVFLAAPPEAVLKQAVSFLLLNGFEEKRKKASQGRNTRMDSRAAPLLRAVLRAVSGQLRVARGWIQGVSRLNTG